MSRRRLSRSTSCWRSAGDAGYAGFAVQLNPDGLACYGASDVTVVGFVHEPDGLGGTNAVAIEPTWLTEWGLFLYASARKRDGAPVDDPYVVAYPPGSGDPNRRYDGKWVSVVAHFDDAAAQTCHAEGPADADPPSDEEAVAMCRQILVLSSVRVTSAPDSATVPLGRPGPDPAVLLLAAGLGLIAWIVAALAAPRGNRNAPVGDRGVGLMRAFEDYSAFLALLFAAVVFAAVALGAALAVEALALVAVVFEAAAFVVDLAGALVVFGAAVVASAAAAGAVSARVVFDSAARALPAAVCAPFAFVALPAAMRALAAFVAWALDVLFATWPATTALPPTAALTLRVRRDLRRAAAFGWIAPAFAARSSAETASASVAAMSCALFLRLGDRDGLGDQRLRDGPPGLQDGPPALGLADALQPGRGASALPFPGGSSHGG